MAALQGELQMYDESHANYERVIKFYPLMTDDSPQAKALAGECQPAASFDREEVLRLRRLSAFFLVADLACQAPKRVRHFAQKERQGDRKCVRYWI